MKIFNGLEELSRELGNGLGHSDWYEVTQDQINGFADATGDHQWIHVDPEAAANGPFGTTIAHGLLTLSLLPRFAAELWRIDGLKLAVNYGFDRIRFPSVVRVGDKVRGSAVLSTIDAGSGGTQATFAVTVEIDGGTKPACVAEWVILLVE